MIFQSCELKQTDDEKVDKLVNEHHPLGDKRLQTGNKRNKN